MRNKLIAIFGFFALVLEFLLNVVLVLVVGSFLLPVALVAVSLYILSVIVLSPLALLSWGYNEGNLFVKGTYVADQDILIRAIIAFLEYGAEARTDNIKDFDCPEGWIIVSINPLRKKQDWFYPEDWRAMVYHPTEGYHQCNLYEFKYKRGFRYNPKVSDNA